MSRRINEDFVLLKQFIEDYQIAQDQLSSEQNEKYKSMHKKLFGFLVFAAEFKEQNINSNSNIFFEETSSDLMLSLFCVIQGMYKPAKLQLRCGVENFLKALLVIDTPQIVTETSVYTIFDVAAKDRHFSGKIGNMVLQNIHNDYVRLCHTVHGDTSMMHPLSALSLLPEYDKTLLYEFVKMYIRCVEQYLKILYLNYPYVLDSMHPDNKQDVLDAMAKKTKAEVVLELYK